MKNFMRLFLFLAAALTVQADSVPIITPLPDDPACTAKDRKFMRRAIELAQDSVNRD